MSLAVGKPDKNLFPHTGLTKAGLADYYERIAPYLLPHIKVRPLTLYRCPDGIDAEGFFQKKVPNHFPGWISTATVDRKEGGRITHALADSADTLRFLVDQGTTALHVWLARADRPARPDRLIFDLDPPGDNFERVICGARALRDALADRDLDSYVMTTGSSGLHVVVPLDCSADFETVHAFAQDVASTLARAHRKLFTTEQRKDKRGSRLYLDTQRNAYAQTGIAPYSVRALPRAPIATPLAWEELTPTLDSRSYRVDNIFKRLAQRNCPWRDMQYAAQSLLAKDS